MYFFLQRIDNTEIGSSFERLKSTVPVLVLSHFFESKLFDTDDLCSFTIQLLTKIGGPNLLELVKSESKFYSGAKGENSASNKILSLILIFKRENLSDQERQVYMSSLIILYLSNIYFNFREEDLEKYAERLQELKKVLEVLECKKWGLNSINLLVSSILDFSKLSLEDEQDAENNAVSKTARTQKSKDSLLKTTGLYINRHSSNDFNRSFKLYSKRKYSNTIVVNNLTAEDDVFTQLNKTLAKRSAYSREEGSITTHNPKTQKFTFTQNSVKKAYLDKQFFTERTKRTSSTVRNKRIDLYDAVGEKLRNLKSKNFQKTEGSLAITIPNGGN